MEASLTCTVWTCGDWMTEGWAAWITPCTWTVWPLGSCTSVTVGLLEETWAAAIDAWNTQPHRHRGDKQISYFSWSVKTSVFTWARVMCWASDSATAVSPLCCVSAPASMIIQSLQTAGNKLAVHLLSCTWRITSTTCSNTHTPLLIFWRRVWLSPTC